MRRILWLAATLLSGLSLAQYPMRVQHDAGDTVIAKKPERIVVLGEELMELLIPLGVKPVGYGSSRMSGVRVGGRVEGLTYYRPEEIGPAVFVGDAYTQPNLEAITALKPDLILFWATAPKSVAEALKKIAPTIGWDYNRDEKLGWRRAFSETARVLGREKQAEEALKRYTQQLEAYRSRAAPFVAHMPRVTVLFFYNEETTGIFGPRFGFSIALTRLGFELAGISGVSIPDRSYAPISTEMLLNVQSDWALYLRPKSPDGRYPELTSERMLKQSKVPIYRFLLDVQEPQSGPITDLRRIEGILRLLETGAQK